MTVVSTENFGFVTYNDKPVLFQHEIATGLIEITYYDQSQEIVNEDDWTSSSKLMLMPRKHGRRAHVLRNWDKYKHYATEKEGSSIR